LYCANPIRFLLTIFHQITLRKICIAFGDNFSSDNATQRLLDFCNNLLSDSITQSSLSFCCCYLRLYMQILLTKHELITDIDGTKFQWLNDWIKKNYFPIIQNKFHRSIFLISMKLNQSCSEKNLFSVRNGCFVMDLKRVA